MSKISRYREVVQEYLEFDEVDTVAWDHPETGISYELGVEVSLNYGKARQLFERFGIPVITSSNRDQAEAEDLFADFCTSEQIEAFRRFVKVKEPDEDIMLDGLWNFPAANIIPNS
ncbi:hypothetical protein FOQG_02019 [Fusarium oxysporum f. sp. raphani 54005]|uniref:Uncharacterized protein n=1 Tax=Fusarium oxysporum f. sp. raphani 54005 TaxID=1089458 RepID=X0DZD6_FUSOX|nr:hypothetical protein FOQG_02019 [Fusarium oxysporum f. sp. raphani 54005]